MVTKMLVARSRSCKAFLFMRGRANKVKGLGFTYHKYRGSGLEIFGGAVFVFLRGANWALFGSGFGVARLPTDTLVQCPLLCKTLGKQPRHIEEQP